MRALFIAKTNLLGIFRNLKSTAIIFILPIVFMAIFAFVFGAGFENVTFELGYLKNDNNEVTQLIDTLESIKNEDDSKLFQVQEFDDKDTALKAAQNEDIHLFIFLNDEGIFEIYLDRSNFIAAAAEGIIKDIINDQADKILVKDIISKSQFSQFEVLVPGLIVYGILMLLPQVAHQLAEIKEKGYIFRYYTSKTKARDIIFGFLISQTVIAAIQTIIMITSAVLFGFNPAPIGLIGTILVIIPTNFFVIGLGLLLGSFANKTAAGENLGTLFSIILGFLSGSFISNIEDIKLNFFGNELPITNFIPTHYATSALRKLLLFEHGIQDVLYEIAVISICGLTLLIVGVMIYQRKQLKASD